MNIKLLLKSFLVTILSVLVCFFFIEIFLRFFGYKPWKSGEIQSHNIYREDKTKGWLSQQGDYEIVASKTYSKKSKISILEDGSRLTGNINDNEKKIIFIGGSFTQGWGVDDNETFSYLIQNQLKDYKIKNFGQGGYSGLQSLLLLDEILKTNLNTVIVVYGFIEHHEYRNVARGSWLELLLKHSNTSHQSTPKIPYATINKDGNLIIHKPIGYLKLPLREHLSTMVFLEKSYMSLKTRKRKKIQKEVVKKIAFEMKKISNLNNSKFVFLNLNSDLSPYKDFLTKNNILHSDCNLKLSEEYLIPGDYHPNKKGHSYFSSCIMNYLKETKLLF